MSRKYSSVGYHDTYVQCLCKDFIKNLSERLDKVPEEYRDHAVIHIYGVEDYGDVEVNIDLYYEAEDTPEEIEIKRQAEESRKNQEIFNARQVLKKYGIE